MGELHHCLSEGGWGAVHMLHSKNISLNQLNISSNPGFFIPRNALMIILAEVGTYCVSLFQSEPG
jgi:hypothetical protein